MTVCPAAVREDRSVETLHFLRCSRHQSQPAMVPMCVQCVCCIVFMHKYELGENNMTSQCGYIHIIIAIFYFILLFF